VSDVPCGQGSLSSAWRGQASPRLRPVAGGRESPRCGRSPMPTGDPSRKKHPRRAARHGDGRLMQPSAPASRSCESFYSAACWRRCAMRGPRRSARCVSVLRLRAPSQRAACDEIFAASQRTKVPRTARCGRSPAGNSVRPFDSPADHAEGVVAATTRAAVAASPWCPGLEQSAASFAVPLRGSGWLPCCSEITTPDGFFGSTARLAARPAGGR